MVTNGPVATAGSISNFLNINGMIVPTVAATIMETQILKPTTTPRYSWALAKVTFAKTPNSMPYRIPVSYTHLTLPTIYSE